MQRWTVELAEEFEPEFNYLHEDVSIEILALSRHLQGFGPQLGKALRPILLLDSYIYGDPVDFPGLASVIRECLLEAA